jgi:hypothetical protein
MMQKVCAWQIGLEAEKAREICMQGFFIVIRNQSNPNQAIT